MVIKNRSGKTRGSADPANWRVLTRLDRFLDLIDRRTDQ